MAHFYGKVHGKNDGTSTRTGTPNSGLMTEAMGWKGRIEVHIYNSGGEDQFVVHLLNHPDQPAFVKVLARGVLDTSYHKDESNGMG